MGAVTICKEGRFVHSEHSTKAKLNKLPPKVKEIISKSIKETEIKTESEQTPEVEQ